MYLRFWPKETDLESVAYSCYVGSNPTIPTLKKIIMEDNMSNCHSCAYYIRPLNESTYCLMRHSYQIVDGVNVFPKKCEDYKEVDGVIK